MHWLCPLPTHSLASGSGTREDHALGLHVGLALLAEVAVMAGVDVPAAPVDRARRGCFPSSRATEHAMPLSACILSSLRLVSK